MTRNTTNGPLVTLAALLALGGTLWPLGLSRDGAAAPSPPRVASSTVPTAQPVVAHPPVVPRSVVLLPAEFPAAVGFVKPLDPGSTF